MEQKSVERMGKAPIQKLMLTMGFPVIVSMMLQALYNIVDSAFVSNMQGGEDALNALTLAFPVQMLMVAIGIGTGVGANVLLAKSLGQGNREKASMVAGNAIFLGIIITFIFVLFGFLGVEPYIATQTTNPVIFDMAIEYLRICCICSAGIAFFGIFEKMLQATGLTAHSTVAQISGAVINIVLDPIMIYGLLGFPAMGVAGAAYATVLGQIASFLIALLFHLRLNQSVDKALKYIRPQASLIKGIYAVGIPAIQLREKYGLKKSQPPREYEAVPELPMGQQMQVDFGQMAMQNVDGGHTTVYAAVFVLSRSRYKYAQMQSRPFTSVDLVRICHDRFQYMGGMPAEMVFDQDSIVCVSENAGDIVYTYEFEKFRQECKLAIRMCRRADPESKGKIENAVTYVKGNFLSHRL